VAGVDSYTSSSNFFNIWTDDMPLPPRPQDMPHGRPHLADKQMQMPRYQMDSGYLNGAAEALQYPNSFPPVGTYGERKYAVPNNER
jgi:hypothetical protein